jgi:hypothetical protein
MGLAFISAKREQFEHKRESAKEAELCGPNLFSSRPDTLTRHYRCVLTDRSISLFRGEELVLAQQGDGEIRVFRQNRAIGHVESASAKKILPILNAALELMLVAQVVTVPRLGEKFLIRLVHFD